MRRLMVAVMLAGTAAMHAAAQPPAADWPCPHIKVPEMAVAAMWGGPPPETPDAGWRSDTAVADLVERLSERRLPLEQAQEIDQHREQFVWQHRVFDERLQTLGLVCEVPTRIEQRRFALIRKIQQSYQ